MANRHVFKFFGSFGPGGALVSLSEKICTSLYPAAYNYGDPEQMESQIDKDLKEVRGKYISELFQFKNKFTRRTTGVGSSDEANTEKEKAYKELIIIIKKYIEKMVRLEKNKYMRERIFYQRNNEIVLYEKANKSYHNCRDQVTDNLVKQAKTICKPTQEEFAQHFEQFHVDDQANMDLDDIATQIPLLKAQDYHSTWIKIQNAHREKMKELERLQNVQGQDDQGQEIEGLSAEDRVLLGMKQEEEDQYLLDKLFIETGEDVEDLFIAFKNFKL